MALLLLTRIDFIGLKRLLLLQTPVVDVSLGGLGEFSASPSLLLKLTHIFGTEISWEMKALYIPALIPFVVISACALLLFRPGAKASAGVFKEAFSRVRLPGVALFGALALVGLLMAGGENSCAMSVGRALAKMAGHGWILCAPFLGALGAFFAGSSTVSNLTFSGIQQSIAHSLSIDQTIVLALQSSGSSMGTLVSINNIVAVSAVLGIPLASGGIILKATFWTMMMYGAIAAAMGFLLLQFA